MARTPSVPRAADAQLLASDLDWTPRTRKAMEQAIGDALIGVHRDSPFWRLSSRTKAEGPCPLETVGADLIALAMLGRPESALRAAPAALDALIDDLFPHAARRTLDELDLLEQQLEAEENDLTLRRRIEGDSTALLLRAAEVNRAEALVQMERARVLESQARRVASGYAVAHTPARATAGTTTPGHIAEATDRACSVRPAALQCAPDPRRKVRVAERPLNRAVTCEA